MYERALAIREKVLGPDHPKVAESLNDQAVFFNNQVRTVANSKDLPWRLSAIVSLTYRSLCIVRSTFFVHS